MPPIAEHDHRAGCLRALGADDQLDAARHHLLHQHRGAGETLRQRVAAAARTAAASFRFSSTPPASDLCAIAAEDTLSATG